MQHEDILLTLGEIAVTLAALSGVAGVLGTRSGQIQLSDFDIVLLRNVALIGLGVAAFALLPLVFRGSALAGAAAMRLCSALSGGAFFGGYALSLRQSLAALRSGGLSPGTFALGLVFIGTAVSLLGWNVAAPTASAPARYVLALMAALSVAGINFIVTVLRPKPAA